MTAAHGLAFAVAALGAYLFTAGLIAYCRRKRKAPEPRMGGIDWASGSDFTTTVIVDGEARRLTHEESYRLYRAIYADESDGWSAWTQELMERRGRITVKRRQG